MEEVERLDSYSTKLLLLEAYETFYEIYNHESVPTNRNGEPKRPLAVVAKHPKEDADTYSRLYRIFYRFVDMRIGQMFNIDFGSFLNLPHDYVEHMFKVATDVMEQRKRDPKLQRLLQEMDNMDRGGPGEL